MGEAKRRAAALRAAGEAARDYASQPPEARLGDAPIEARYYDDMRAVARLIDKIFNGAAQGDDRQVGYVLMVFPFGTAAVGRCNYLSNGADRRDIVTLMREMIARFEGQPELAGSA